MSVNEIQEFEAINQLTNDRKATASSARLAAEEVHRSKKMKARKKAAGMMVVTALMVVAAMVGITGLEMIGWINSTFSVVLRSLTGCLAMFSAGYFWHEIKN